jgi:hypothetical protein
VKAKGAALNTGSGSKRLPLIFGVSGHRDLVVADLPQLREHLSQIFAVFRAAYPHTPFRLLSPLAEGADRLVAEVALSSEIGLFVPLPMEQREYERDFPTAKSLAEFRALLARAESCWELPIRTNPRTENRTMQYAEVGDFIARYSHILILLWDGEHNRKIGGTAWVKKRREYWTTADSDPRDGAVPLGYGPTIQVVTPRASGRLPRPRPETKGDLPPSAAEFAATLSKPSRDKRNRKQEQRPPLYQFIYWAINNYNEDVPGSGSVRNRAKRHSATRSRL